MGDSVPEDTVPNFSAETRSRTRVSRRTDSHRQRRSPGWSGLGPRHSSCLWFQVLGVEAYPLLPDMQGDRCNLARQRQARPLRADSLGQQRRVELPERTGLVGGDDRRTVEQIFQIVIMVGVEPANGHLFVGPLQPSFDIAIVGTAVGLDA